ncbi:MAG: DnaJ domain-containing protein [Synergistaceae bacterium]|jgi:hypothetical protein|nr:DnaJ domain-containing protein [Synergistaceae bacterium]
MQTVKNYYFILGVSQKASIDEIKAAYSAMTSLPPQNEAEEAMMREAAEACECLANPRKRREYDLSLGYTDRPRPTGNIHNFGSAETAVAAQLEFNKLEKKLRQRKKNLPKIFVSAILICIAGAAVLRWFGFFRGTEPSMEARAGIFRVIGNEPTAAEEPRAAIERAGGRPTVRSYQVKTGGVVTQDRAVCRAMPSESSRPVAVMRRDSVVFATKEMRGSDESVWYYVSCSEFEGWAKGSDVRIYKY